MLCRDDLEVGWTPDSDAEQRSREALTSVGGSTLSAAWQFPVRQSELRMPVDKTLAVWDRTCGGRGRERLEEYIVRSIRQWRPNVIVTEPADSRNARPVDVLINTIVNTAVEKAADSRAYPAQLSVARLSPWQVTKVFSRKPQGEKGSFRLATSEHAPRLGRSYADHAASARGLVSTRYSVAPDVVEFDLQQSRLTSEAARNDFFSGISLPPDSEARRAVREPTAASVDAARQRTQRQQVISQLITANAGQPQGGGFLLAHIEEATRGLDSTEAGEFLVELAHRFRHAGQFELAADAMQMFVQRQPHHAFADEAFIWLVQYYASGEAVWRAQRPKRSRPGAVAAAPLAPDQKNREGIRQVGFQNETPPSEVNSPVNASTQPAARIERSGANTTPSSLTSRAVTIGNYLERRRPELFADPRLRFPLAAAVRQTSGSRHAERFFRGLLTDSKWEAWWLCARTEQWLARPEGECPKPVCHASKVAARPRLDGKLDEAFWQSAQPMRLKSPLGDDASWPAAMMLAHDDQFLYVGIRCRKAPGIEYPRTDEPRPRDSHLADRDRVDLLIDVDRDYATYFRLTVDHRGWTGEACLGDWAWNPEWFVAATGDDNSWTIEAAIAFDELAGRPASDGPDGRVWAVGVQRTIPGVGFQSWTAPAAVDPAPEGFGLLELDR